METIRDVTAIVINKLFTLLKVRGPAPIMFPFIIWHPETTERGELEVMFITISTHFPKPPFRKKITVIEKNFCKKAAI